MIFQCLLQTIVNFNATTAYMHVDLIFLAMFFLWNAITSRARWAFHAVQIAYIWSNRLVRGFRHVAVLEQQIGSSSNNDGDGNQDVKKAMGLITQNNNFEHASRFFVHFFTVLARLRRENA